MKVYAFDADANFYPLNSPKIGSVQFRNKDNEVIYLSSPALSEGNKYHLNNSDLIDVKAIEIWNLTDAEFTFPFDPDLYEYYFLGTLLSNSSSNTLSTFKPTHVILQGYDVNAESLFNYTGYDLNIYNVDTFNIRGFGFSQRIDFESYNNTGLLGVVMSGDKDGYGNKPANLIMEFGILAVDKSSSETAVLMQILDKLDVMQTSLISSIDSASDNVAGAVQDSATAITGAIANQYEIDGAEDFGVGQLTDQVEEKLGVLTFGADTLNNFLGLFQASNVGGTELTFPGFQIDVQGQSYNVWPDISFDLAFLEEHFGVLITAVRTVTVLCVWLAVLGYLVKAKDHFINNKG